MAVCNTVVVAKKPHHDKMNESGIIENTAAECSVQISLASDADGSISMTDNDATPSIESTTGSTSSASLLVPLSENAPSDAALYPVSATSSAVTTPKRPRSLFSFPGTYFFFVSRPNCCHLSVLLMLIA